MAEPRDGERRFITPEGVDLRLRLASAGQRASAFLLDLLFMLLVLILFTALIGLVAWAIRWNGLMLIGALWLVGFFLLRNGWFILFEMGGRAATPGKRIMGLRVIARGGGALTGDAVIARNAMREIELFLPLSFLAVRAADGTAGAWTAVFGLLWSGIFLFFPLLNRDRLRVGDLLGGTWVIAVPRRALDRDLAQAQAVAAESHAFTAAQLDIYGVYELQTLEDVLRRRDWEQIYIVSTRIRERIGWGRVTDDAAFLETYYAALRERLERGLLFGSRRADKHDAGSGDQSMTDAHPLDRPVWHALAGRQAALAVGDARAWGFDPALGPLAAAADASAESLAALAALIPPGGERWLLDAEEMPAPPGTIASGRAICHQMVATAIAGDASRDAIPLGDDDAAEMHALATLTRPGPFAAGTHRFGGFVGIRASGRLVAMAGERLKPGDHTEVSGVCTHPDHRGRGHAAGLMRLVARQILARGEMPFLHVYADNAGAIALYEALGFAFRRAVVKTVIRRAG